MTIEEKIEAKRAELVAVTEDQQRKWETFQEKETKLRQDYQTPWYNAVEKQRAIQIEVQILEGVLNEMATA